MPGQSAYQVHDEDVAAAAVDYLNRLGVQKRAFGEIEPFSLSVGLDVAPPALCCAQRRFRALCRLNDACPQRPERHDQVHHPYIRRWREYTGIAEVSDEEVLRSRAAYWGLVRRVDILVGQILAALEANRIGGKYADCLYL